LVLAFPLGAIKEDFEAGGFPALLFFFFLLLFKRDIKNELTSAKLLKMNDSRNNNPGFSTKITDYICRNEFMTSRKKLLITIYVFLVAVALLFISRNYWINWTQRQIFAMIRSKAVLSNSIFLRPDNPKGGHLIYSLKGLERIWPHRVNSLERFKFLYPQFAGFECDIRFDTGTRKLFVAHEPAEITGLTFADYLRGEEGSRKLFWLDVKNLDRFNQEAFCKTLDSLDRIYKINNRIIVESRDTNALKGICRSGWLCSLYLPSGLPVDPREKMEGVAAIRNFLKGFNGYISEDIGIQDRMKRYFPETKQLIWDIRFSDGMMKESLLKLANDSSILVCLINVKSPGYR
jgi:hypothetical protein